MSLDVCSYKIYIIVYYVCLKAESVPLLMLVGKFRSASVCVWGASCWYVQVWNASALDPLFDVEVYLKKKKI